MSWKWLVNQDILGCGVTLSQKWGRNLDMLSGPMCFVLEMGVFSGRFAVVDVFCPENWAEPGIF